MIGFIFGVASGVACGLIAHAFGADANTAGAVTTTVGFLSTLIINTSRD